MSRRTDAQRSVKHDWLDAVLADRAGEMDGYTVAVAASLWSHMNRTGLCWPSLRLIADEAKVSKNTATDRIKVLEAAGYLIVKRRPRGANTYQASGLPRGTDEQSGSSGGTDGRQPRSGSPDELSGSYPETSGSYPELSGSSDELSGSPGGTEHVNPRRGEHVNTGALSGGAPDGAPALDAAERDRAKITLESIDLYVTPLDAEIDAILDKVDPEQIIDPPDDVFIAPVLRKRLEQVGGIGWDQEGGFAATDDMTPAQLVELEQVELNIRVWALNSEATEPGWMIRTLRKREKYLESLKRRAEAKAGAA